MTYASPTHHILSTPDPSLWLPPDAIGTVVTREGKAYRALGMHLARHTSKHGDQPLWQYRK